jgi:hypothetical protein
MSKPLAFPLPQQESPEQVEYTISQDQAAGHHAQEESGYRLLSGREFDQPNLLTSKAPSAKPPLQDYQIELMLLEQQNKKRLMMARQSGLVMETSRADFKEFASPQVSRKRGQEEVEDDREPREGSEGEPGDNHERGGNEERTNECEEVDGVQSYKPVDPAPLSQSKRQKASHAASRGHQPTENPRNVCFLQPEPPPSLGRRNTYGLIDVFCSTTPAQSRVRAAAPNERRLLALPRHSNRNRTRNFKTVAPATQI